MRLPDQTINRLSVLKAIRRHAPLSRSDLPALTGLSRGTITQVTADLVNRELLIEAQEKGKRRSGRPRTYIKINPRGAAVVCASLSAEGALNAAFVDLAGNKTFDIDVTLDYPKDLGDLGRTITNALQEAIQVSPVDRRSIRRVCIAIPALIDHRNGIVYHVGTLPSGDLPLAEFISAGLSLPVTIEHEMVCMARAEHWFGRAQDVETFSVIHIGYYIGSADFNGGLPRLGANGFNSKIEHSKHVLGDDAPPCYCGRLGCVSAFSSMYGMMQRWGRLTELSAAAIGELGSNFQVFLSHFESGDNEVAKIIDQAAEHLGLAIANLVNALDPGTVLILFEGRRLKNALGPKVEAVVREAVYDGVLERTKLVVDTPDPDWKWKGVAALALERIYTDDEDDTDDHLVFESEDA